MALPSVANSLTSGLPVRLATDAFTKTPKKELMMKLMIIMMIGNKKPNLARVMNEMKRVVKKYKKI